MRLFSRLRKRDNYYTAPQNEFKKSDTWFTFLFLTIVKKDDRIRLDNCSTMSYSERKMCVSILSVIDLW